MLKSIFFWLLFLLGVGSFTQNITPNNGVAPANKIIALTNAKLIVSADETIEKGTILIENGSIKNVGKLITIPKNAVKIDLKGYTIYPSFVEIYGTEGMRPFGLKNKGLTPQLNSLKKGPFYWNQAIHPEVEAIDYFDPQLFKAKESYKKNGFGVISIHLKDGILRGTSALMTLSDNVQDNVILSNAANHYSFSKGSSQQTYPSSQMGAIALIRQFFYDAKWYASIQNPLTENLSLKKGLENLALPQIFEVSNQLEAFRALKIANEFGLDLIVKSGGNDYEHIAELKRSGAKLIIPVNFPKAFDVTDPYLSRFVSLADLKEWELKPSNAYSLYKNQIPFCFTTMGLKNKDQFLKNIRKTVQRGLPKNEALRALTENPAKFLNAADKLGTLETGKIANFLVVKGDLFEDGTIYENWVSGKRTVIKDVSTHDIRGTYNLTINKIVYQWIIEGSAEKPKAKLASYVWRTDSLTNSKTLDTLDITPTLQFESLQINMSFTETNGNTNGVTQLNGTYNPSLAIFHGKALLPTGKWVDWSAIRGTKHFEKEKQTPLTLVDTMTIKNIYYPNMAYGFDSLPKPQTFFIKNATIWTNEADGILKNASLLITDGKIKAINPSSASIPNDALIIDATGKHVTCGIIDEHSHIAISKGVNESGQAVSAEVSIADVVRNNDINIYRQLAGGVTASQLLHGSANPIGGQSALIKLKWGFTPEEMRIKDTDGFIKFALGENVKQSNWGDHSTVRFPQTRMGVEQVFYDAFIRARAYKEEWDAFTQLSENKKQSTTAPRKDLELEALVEIITQKRFISCHSYIQSEVNMLMHVADSMGFTLNTFTHILEGYKVADKMKAHGAGASTFADWWAYKYEVNEAIPYNAAILHKMGIITAINSDDAEMGRRLNQEAAKVVKYGGISEEDAWKMVTLNPAILLHLDDKMGSIKKGKDADIVIWSAHPLSIQAKVEQTFVDGILFYDFNRSIELHDRDQKERKRIISLMLAAKKNGESTKLPYKKLNPHYHCDSEGE